MNSSVYYKQCLHLLRQVIEKINSQGYSQEPYLLYERTDFNNNITTLQEEDDLTIRFFDRIIVKNAIATYKKFSEIFKTGYINEKADFAFSELLEKSFHKVTDGIPEGIYCYSGKHICPYWLKLYNSLPDQSAGYCTLINEGDFSSFGLLWDQCKECGVKEFSDEQLQIQEDCMSFNEDVFNHLQELWDKDTKYLSSTQQICEHESFTKLKNVRWACVPFIIERLKKMLEEDDHICHGFQIWGSFELLYQIVGKKHSPELPEEDCGKCDKIARMWVEWWDKFQVKG